MGRPRRAVAIAGASLAAWLALELVAWGVLTALERPPERVRDPTGTGTWLVQAKEAFRTGLYVWDQHCLWTLRPRYHGGEHSRPFWGGQPLELNQLGMRSPEHPRQKPPGVRRILVLGGSHPMGMYVGPGEVYSAVLERRLATAGRGRWEVLNAAAPGHTSFQALQYLRHYGLALSPDIVIADVGVNDTLPLSPDFPLPDHEVSRPPAWAASARSLLELSAVYRLLRRWIRRPSGPVSGQRVPPDRHRAHLQAMRALGAERGFHVLGMGQVRVDVHGPGRAQCLFDESELAPGRVDLCARLGALGMEAKRYFVDPIHANAAGHALIAEWTFEALEQLGWLTPAAR